MSEPRRQTGEAEGTKAPRAFVRSSYGPWLLLAVALLAAPASVPVAVAAQASTVVTLDRPGVAILGSFGRDVGDPIRSEAVESLERVADIDVALATPRETIGLGRFVLPPPLVA
ncbi:MAG: hypothetical protein AAGI53_01765 [Planctomycetota bacterium]